MTSDFLIGNAVTNLSMLLLSPYLKRLDRRGIIFKYIIGLDMTVDAVTF